MPGTHACWAVHMTNLLDDTRAHAHEEVRVYRARQFAVMYPLVRA
ncbi:hypothetical protein P8605_24335 [Streptomyces sp. T-3]|nr:hypothetical protein [Streptomyces sp. T-3]